ncbi:MAG TPA: TonB-dependent receptor [Verrucomicrobiae bacterium]|nr:TonB-dependent receptor [Verrucomicrobiae bacterium]
MADFSLEELINIEVTSVGKKETRLHRAPAAIAVLTDEDLRTLGANTIPEALRAVPGVHVARISGNRWAVSARGMNDEYSNKLLVLMDGRSVYSPMFGGVHWNTPDLVLEDLDRIEVIRGPGATLWGANSVNGVINIISKSARETQGGLVSSSFGTEEQPSVSARYGGTLSSNFFYRVYTKYYNREGFDGASGNSMSDDWSLARGGLRMDWEPGDQNRFTLLGEYYGGVFGEQIGKIAIYPAPAFRNIGIEADASGGNLLGRWISHFSDESELSLQVYYDRYQREHAVGGGTLVASPNEFAPGQNHVTETRDTWDVDLQHRWHGLARHEFVWGAGFRTTRDYVDAGGAEVSWNPARTSQNLFNAFVQDEISIVENAFSVTIGSKIEHNDYTGFEFQPGGRLLWTPTEQQTVWASLARAVRNPTRLERDGRINIGAVPPMAPTDPAVIVTATPNRHADSETVIAYELGYRIEPSASLSFDVAGFYNDYELLANRVGGFSFQPTPVPHVVQDYGPKNGISGYTYGAELLSRWQVSPAWRLTASYTWWRSHFEVSPYSDVTNPEHQFNVRSTVSFGRGWEMHAAAYYVGSLGAVPQNSPGPVRIPAYLRGDLGLSWKLSDNFEFSVWGQNLFDGGHPEFGGYKSARFAEIPRSVFGKVTVRF